MSNTVGKMQPCPAGVCCQDLGCPGNDCEFASPPSSFDWRVDFGAGGWTDDNCADCPNVAGTFVLTHISGCTWNYQDNTWCPERDPDQLLSISLQYFSFGVAVSGNITSHIPFGNPAFVQYRTSFSDPDCESILDGSNQATLTKFTDTPGDPCNGSMPATCQITKL